MQAPSGPQITGGGLSNGSTLTGGVQSSSSAFDALNAAVSTSTSVSAPGGNQLTKNVTQVGLW